MIWSRHMATLFATVCSLFLFASALAQETPAHTRVVLISIDGLKPEYVLNADVHRLKIPNLLRFLKEGTYSTGVHGVVPTVTYPSHTTLITGVSPAKHGIYANTTFDRLQKNNGGWYWYAGDIKVPTLWDAAATAGLTTANVHWPSALPLRISLGIFRNTGVPELPTTANSCAYLPLPDSSMHLKKIWAHTPMASTNPSPAMKIAPSLPRP